MSEIDSRMNETQFGVFAKYWRPGEVKTRLAASIGAERASQIYKAFLEVLLRRFSGIAEFNALSYSPAEEVESFVRLVPKDWTLCEQGLGDLGERMERYFSNAFERGQKRVVLIGSDSPTLPTEHIRLAFQKLKEVSVVLGPSTDGGYYLVGASQQVLPIFRDVVWSSPSVWEQTIALLEKANISYSKLPVWYDVDDINDLQRLDSELKQTMKAQDQSASLYQELAELVQDALESSS